MPELSKPLDEKSFARYGGKLWDENRRFSVKALRNLGFGKATMKEVVAEGCDRLVNRIAKAEGNPVDLSELILASASDNVGLFILGRRYSFGNHEHRNLRTALRGEFMASRDPSALDSLPAFVTTLARLVPFTRAANLVVAVKSIQQFVSRHLPDHVDTYRDGDDRDFMDAYLKKCGEADNCQSTYPRANTVSAVLMRLLLLLATHAETVQDRIHREIDEFMGSERQPAWEDRRSTPYTVATIWEAHRWHPLLPFGVARRAYQDVVIGEYFVPKDTTTIANIWAVHNDPTFWIEPEKFDPARFLNNDGSLAWEKAERVIPFSVGKRMCPAEIFASVEIYVYLTRLMQKFFILPEEGVVFDVNIPDTLMMQPGRLRFRCIPRAPSLP
ncbi:cytochrome P450 2J1-like [Dermacentor variabilis]|uniref:cytochrome P450 2J1-like n=1 Tax=Dermacentor variabilis TaxID=34621 RepID=UPI003F5C64D9